MSIDGWAIAPAEACGVVIDAIAVYVNTSRYAMGFVARWLVPSNPPGFYQMREDEPARATAAAQIAAATSAARDAISIGLGGGGLTRPHGSNDHVISVTLSNNDGCIPAPFSTGCSARYFSFILFLGLL
jgi:hypothetical protein